MAQAPCARCGGPNPPAAEVCQWCRASLVRPPTPPTGPVGYRPLELPGVPGPHRLNPLPATSNVVYYGVGIPLLVFGIIALLAAAAISSSVASFNSACSQNPVCTPEPDPSGGVAAVGVVLLLIGIILILYGATQGSGDASSLGPDVRNDW